MSRARTWTCLPREVEPEIDAMERSPDRFLVLQLEKEDIRPRCQYPYMPYGIDFAAADLDSFLTRVRYRWHQRM
jgi:hypothetical protein